MASSGFVELERKYDVDDHSPLPPLHELPGVSRVEQPVEHQLEAVYFDTEDLLLASRGISLRRRTGGEDAGWHLKMPAAGGRREFHEPLGDHAGNVPAPLLQLVRVHVRDRILVPVARLQTRRVVHRLRGPGDVHLADMSDDHVQARSPVTGAVGARWREWELELADGRPELLDAGEDLFAGAGIRPAAHESKLRRALGSRPVPAVAAAPQPRRKGPAAAVVLAYLDQQVRALKEQDPLVRQDAEDSVHQMRLATRRLRSALATYRKLLEPDTAGRLRSELRWLAHVLGDARDAAVMQERVAGMLESEDADLVMGPVSRRLEIDLGQSSRDARAAVLRALDEERYFRLLDALDALLADPPLTKLGSQPARKVVPKLVQRDLKRLKRAVKAARRAPAGENPDLLLHEARKCAKRLRYAAEAAASVAPKQARRLADAAHEVQDILGGHQDSVVARQLLRRLGAESFGLGENGFTYGRLHALEEAGAADSAARFRQAWKNFPAAALVK
ncbi:CYTH and CHAD domain-containing protein [Arthrobacter mobilis]|uniref:CYTH and CHAD domain-containing protein n=1 Tax=Arthrobacter mobilis TaxID=2724944 RepID=A0A7X6K6H2_9MICC|nr:CYTH and CHAD domain-containing protein [Arthrobacter mobilis]NKX55325.1 CYTH and CHAD domain-containing protein [Arthrobacter mobilis]